MFWFWNDSWAEGIIQACRQHIVALQEPKTLQANTNNDGTPNNEKLLTSRINWQLPGLEARLSKAIIESSYLFSWWIGMDLGRKILQLLLSSMAGRKSFLFNLEIH